MWNGTKCNKCGDCLVKCQYVEYDLQKAIQEMDDLIEGEDAEILTKCITCMACNEYCTKGANPFDLICQRQEEKNALAVTRVGTFLYNALRLVPNQVIKGDPDKPACSLCIMEAQFPVGAFRGQMFRGLTMVKGFDYFCWFGYKHIAKGSLVSDNAHKFVDRLASLGTTEVILAHDDCYSMLTKEVEGYGIKVPFKATHIFEYLARYLKAHQKSIAKLNKRVAYQRPCSSRYTPEKDLFLDEIFELIGVVEVARKYRRESAICCGGAISQIEGRHEDARKVQTKNLDDAIEHEAQALISLCPGCYVNLRGLSERRGLPPIFITNLCRMALGEEQWPA